MERLLSFLEKKVIKFALKKLLGNAVAGGLKAWFIKFFIKEILFDKAVEPLLMEMGYGIDVAKGYFLVKRLDKAKEGDSVEDYDNVIDDILG